MSKRIVLRSLLAMVMVGFVLSLSSCKEEKKIVGVWKYDKVDIKELACSDPLTTIMLRSFAKQMFESAVGSEVEFTKDGKALFRGGDGTETGSYRVSDNKLAISSGGLTETYNLSFPDKKTMCWDMTMDKSMLEEYSLLISLFLEEEVEITKCAIQITLKKQ